METAGNQHKVLFGGWGGGVKYMVQHGYMCKCVGCWPAFKRWAVMEGRGGCRGKEACTEVKVLAAFVEISWKFALFHDLAVFKSKKESCVVRLAGQCCVIAHFEITGIICCMWPWYRSSLGKDGTLSSRLWFIFTIRSSWPFIQKSDGLRAKGGHPCDATSLLACLPLQQFLFAISKRTSFPQTTGPTCPWYAHMIGTISCSSIPHDLCGS